MLCVLDVLGVALWVVVCWFILDSGLIDFVWLCGFVLGFDLDLFGGFGFALDVEGVGYFGFLEICFGIGLG